MSKYICEDLSYDDWDKWAKTIRDWIVKKTGYQRTNFFRDGILDIKEFSDSEFRPLFILKEVNDEGPFDVGLQDIRTTDINNGVTMWRRLVTLAREMHKIHDGIDDINHEIIRILDEPGKEAYGVYKKKVAAINLKKAGGGSSDNSEASKRTIKHVCHACQYSEKLRSQISMINPSVIICCGTYEILRDVVYGPELFSTIENLTIRGYHPSRSSNAMFYDEVLALYKRVLSNPQ